MVIKLPEHVSAKEARTFMRALQPELRRDRPRVVVDMSDVKDIDTAALDMLLECMSIIARRDGAVKLAGISAVSRPSLTNFVGIGVWLK